MKKFILGLSFIALFSGCNFFSDDMNTPEEKLAVVRVTNDYLRFIAGGHHQLAEGMVGWPMYAPLKVGVTREVFNNKIVANQGRWSAEAHPLLGLDVVDVRVKEDEAKVVLVKKSTGKEVKLRLRWAGRGWMIVDDNVFTEAYP